MNIPNINFYDIESLRNLFTLANYRTKDDVLEIFYQLDNPEIIQSVSPQQFYNLVRQEIWKENQNFTGRIDIYNLAYPDNIDYMARIFGLSDAPYVNNPLSESAYGPRYRITCDTDPDYDPELHPYFMGYNSYNYDTAMLALYFHEAVTSSKQSIPGKPGQFHIVSTMTPVSASRMRDHSNFMFTPRFKSCMPDYLRTPANKAGVLPYRADYNAQPARIRKNMIMTGRHLDIARLNEKQQKVGLKRLLGMKGLQIMESNKLKAGQDTINTLDELLNLMAYNTSDVVNLPYLFMDKTYSGQFYLKKALLEKYPELIYEKKPTEYAPNIGPAHVRRDRLCIDNSSSQMATKALCPYGHLTDMPVVSFLYPSERKAKEAGIPRINVLEETRKFFHSRFPQPEIRAEFDRIYEYYKSIEGKNFNESANYAEDYPIEAEDETLALARSLVPPDRVIDLNPRSLSDVPPINSCMTYYKKDGTQSSCFVNFSTGGIHGAEYNQALYAYDLYKYQAEANLHDQAKTAYPNPDDLRAAKKVTLNGKEYKASYFLKTAKKGEPLAYKELAKPELFKKDTKGSYKLNKRYNYTSAGQTNHEDFTSYYPILLCNMDAFANPGLGYDRYFEIFGQKSDLGKKMKDKSLPESDREMYAVQREGTKLILNSASGSADAKFESNIRMNNTIIAMRIIGQLFSFTIGQAQAYEGARIISTNTDGLFTIMEETINNQILARESANINVEIEPELTYLISKDTNNRIEMEHDKGYAGEIQRASGGTLACYKGPNLTKSLSHPAIIDYALTEYLIVAAWNHKGLTLDKPFDMELGRKILEQAPVRMPPHQLVAMYQNIVASSPSSDRYVYLTTPDDPKTPVPMQHYNRIFIVKEGTPGAVYLHVASLRKITDAALNKRRRDGDRAQQHDETAKQVLIVNGVDWKNIPSNKEAAVLKVTNLDDTWPVLVNNHDMTRLSDEQCLELLNNLDYEKYLQLFADGFMDNWWNNTPANEDAIIAAKEAEAAAKQREKDEQKALKAAEKAAAKKTAKPQKKKTDTEITESAAITAEHTPA